MDSSALGRDGSRQDAAGSTRQRILSATSEVLQRRGTTKLSLSEVAVHAGLSRMTLYRMFPSKDHLISAYTTYESDNLEANLAKATVGLRGTERVDATLKFLVDYQASYSGVRMIDIEPGQVTARMSRLMPILRKRLQSILPGPNAEVAAGTVMRVIVSHYVVAGDDAGQFLAQLRHAAGITPAVKPPRAVKSVAEAKSPQTRHRS